MYKVMIIDDDTQVRERLKAIIDWKGLPLELVCEAGDSDTALEMYLLYRPKIIISDISIPVISGLELAEIMRKEDSDLQFIIITGYNDFEWAKQSVRLGAIDLMSKPVFPEEINRSLNKVINFFTKKQQEQSSVDFLHGLVTENLPKMQETYMMNLIAITAFRFLLYRTGGAPVYKAGHYNLAIYFVAVFAGTILLGMLFRELHFPGKFSTAGQKDKGTARKYRMLLSAAALLIGGICGYMIFYRLVIFFYILDLLFGLSVMTLMYLLASFLGGLPFTLRFLDAAGRYSFQIMLLDPFFHAALYRLLSLFLQEGAVMVLLIAVPDLALSYLLCIVLERVPVLSGLLGLDLVQKN